MCGKTRHKREMGAMRLIAQQQRAVAAARVFNKEADDRCGRLRSRAQARETKVARIEESKDVISLSVRFESDL